MQYGPDNRETPKAIWIILAIAVALVLLYELVFSVFPNGLLGRA